MISNAMIQKWLRMLRHDSVLHVEQAEGQYYSVSEIAGYYNNFCGKIQNTKNFDTAGIPQNIALQSFNMVWAHMTCGLKQKIGTTTILFWQWRIGLSVIKKNLAHGIHLAYCTIITPIPLWLRVRELLYWLVPIKKLKVKSIM